jgi:hypothetical protein
MRNVTKTAVVAVSAIAAVLAVAVAAYAGAGTLQGTLKIAPSGGHYGDELTIAPSMNTTAFPGDTVEIQYLAADNTWTSYGEKLSVEETTSPDATSQMTTIGPLALILDGSLDYPAVVRAIFTPKNSAEGTTASDPVWITMTRNTRTKVAIDAPKTAKRRKAYVVESTVLPVSGIGAVRVKVKRLSTGATRSMTVQTDDSGIASFTFKQSAKGRYLITEKFLGNRFGAASSTAAKIIVVK